MSVTVANLHPEVAIGATDREEGYMEVYLEFRDFRIRITRANYSPKHQDLWVDIGSTVDPAAFFRLDFVVDALRRLEQSDAPPSTFRSPGTLAELDSMMLTMHDKLREHLSEFKYAETKTMIGRVMHEYSDSAQRNHGTASTHGV